MAIEEGWKLLKSCMAQLQLVHATIQWGISYTTIYTKTIIMNHGFPCRAPAPCYATYFLQARNIESQVSALPCSDPGSFVTWGGRLSTLTTVAYLVYSSGADMINRQRPLLQPGLPPSFPPLPSLAGSHPHRSRRVSLLTVRCCHPLPAQWP